MQNERGKSFSWEEVFNSLNDIIFIIDTSYSIISANEKTTAFFNFKKSKSSHKCHKVLFNKKQPCEFCPINKNSLLQDSCLEQKQIHISDRIFKLKMNCIQGNSENENKYVIFLHDITSEIQAKEKLELTENRYRLLAENSSDVILLNDKNLNFIYASPSAKSLTGFSPEEFLKLDMSDVLTKESYKRARALYADDKSRGKVTDEYQIIKKDKTLHWVEMAITPIRNEYGEITSYISQSRDVNDKKVALDALKVSEERYRLIRDNADMKISYFSKSGNVVFINKASANYLGGTPDELVGKHYKEILKPKRAKVIKNRFKYILENPAPTDFEDLIEIGTTKTHLLTTLSGVQNSQNETVGILSIIKDVTALKKAQNQISRHANQLKGLLEIAQLNQESRKNILDLALEKAQTFTQSENGFLYFYDEGSETFLLESYSKSTTKLFGLNDTKKLDILNDLNIWSDPIRKGEPIYVNNVPEYYLKYLKHTEPHNEIRNYLGIPISWNNKIVGLVGLANKEDDYNMNDIHQVQLLMNTVWKIIERNQAAKELIQAKEKAEESDRLKSAFLSNMSHEIRTPINGIMGFLSLIREDDLEKNIKEKYYNIIDSNFNHLIRLITDIIDISRLEANQVYLNCTNIYLPDLIHEVVDLIQSENYFLLKEDVSVTIEIPEPDTSNYYINTDKSRLKQILTNLINNAFKFTDEGEIRVGFETKGEFIEFYVHDTGIGICKEQQKLIFERFRQADETLTRKHGGTGLGLSISKLLVELMKGEISVESEPGSFSRFSFTLPNNSTHKKKIFIKSKIQKPAEVSWENKHFLIVEDDDSNFLYLREFLKKPGVTISRTVSCEETYQFLENNSSLNLVLLDIRLTDGAGTELIPVIRDKFRNIPIIAQTSYALENDRKKYLDAGCNDYISKPINIRILKKMINRQLARFENINSDLEMELRQE